MGGVEKNLRQTSKDWKRNARDPNSSLLVVRGGKKSIGRDETIIVMSPKGGPMNEGRAIK